MADDRKDKVKGEGDPEAARNYNESQQEFVESGGVEEHADERRDLSDDEKKRLREAERKGRERAHEKDPNVPRDYRSGS